MEEKKYETTVIAKGFAITVKPSDRAADVMHYLITGGLLGGRSLDNVEWEEIDDSTEQGAFLKRRSASLQKAMAQEQKPSAETLKPLPINKPKPGSLNRKQKRDKQFRRNKRGFNTRADKSMGASSCDERNNEHC